MTRYTRQIRLAEIGEGGQARIVASEVPLGAPTGLARDVERAYVRLAGASTIERAGQGAGEGAPLDVDVAALGLRHAAPREVAEGALRALVALRRILEVR